LFAAAVRKNWNGSIERVEGKVVRQAVAECLKHAKQRLQRRIAADAQKTVSSGSSRDWEEEEEEEDNERVE
jgi:hypothetical protein